MEKTKSYSCLTCGEQEEFKVRTNKILNNTIEIEVECCNCLSKLFVDGKHSFVRYKCNLD